MQRQRQQQQIRRSTHHRRTAICLMLLTLSSTIDFSCYGFLSSSSTRSSNTIDAPTSAKTASKTASFYTSSTVLNDDFPSVTFPPPITIKKRGRMRNGMYSIRDINIKKKESKSPTKTNQQDDFITGSKLPWIDYNNDYENENDNENENEKYDDNVYLSHWEWQLSHFKQHLTNFRINNDTDDETNDDCSDDLMYIEGQNQNKKQQQQQQRIYTVSYKSDEYRDIRITYMNFPGSSQCFRCMCYPNSINVPILGMAYMQFGSSSSGSKSNIKNMAFMDYQPLLSTNNNDKYELELLRIRSEIPLMNSPISHKHFDSIEERKYFTDYPLICKWDNDGGDSDAEFHRKELVRAQHDYVKTHIKLTKEEMMHDIDHDNVDNDDHDHDNDSILLLKLHSDFDTFVSSKEPAGKVLCNVFGTEIGNQLVHRILFPLSRNI